MFFCFTFGFEPHMTKMKDYKDMRLQCPTCYQVQALPQKRWTWFALCYLPLFPIYMKKVPIWE